MSGPLVSVVIPTYNRADEVCCAIDNAFTQTYPNIELIIVDDGSTDDTQARLKAYGDRIRVIVQKNQGPAVARNRGAAAARGEIIAFQDSDDLWKPTKLEKQVALLQKLGPKVVCCLCNIEMVGGKNRKPTSFEDSLVHPQHEEGIWVNALEVLATRFVLFSQAVAIRREVFERVGGFREDIKYDEDYDLALRLALEGPWGFIKEPLVTYIPGETNSFSQAARKDLMTLKECEVRIVEHVLSRVNGSEHTRCQGLPEPEAEAVSPRDDGDSIDEEGFLGRAAIGSLDEHESVTTRRRHSGARHGIPKHSPFLRKRPLCTRVIPDSPIGHQPIRVWPQMKRPTPTGAWFTKRLDCGT